MREGKYVVLIVEDDAKLRQSLAEYLSRSEYTVLESETGGGALDLFFQRNHEIDIILLDVMLPDMDGYQVLRTIREFSRLPIIMVTSLDSDENQLEGLTSGADNYLTKPFRLRLVQAHMEALLSRSYNMSQLVTFGRLTVDKRAQLLKIGQDNITLTPKEFALLMYFISNSNQVLSREVILDAVWGYDYTGDIRTVDTVVKQVRRKLTDRCPYIHAVYGIGYIFRDDDERDQTQQQADARLQEKKTKEAQ